VYGMIVVLGVCAAGWLFVFSPLQAKNKAQEEEHEKYLQSEEQANVELIQKRERVEGMEQLSNHLKQAAGILDGNQGLPEVVRKLGQLVQGTSLRLDDIQPGTGESDQYYQKTTLELKVYGLFPNMFAFLVEMAEELPYVRIDSLQIRRHDEGAMSRCNISMKLDIFESK
jgi:Tfp pilus assembly protein PilO